MIGKPRGKQGLLPVFVYDPAIKRKRYVGQRPTERQARLLEAEKILEFANQRADHGWTIDSYAQRWLDVLHTPAQGRSEPSTRRHNQQRLRAFCKRYGTRALEGGLSRREATDWAAQHDARTMKAMFADAVREGACEHSPFEQVRIHEGRGRKDIDPLTEAEVERLAQCALRSASAWGPELWALVMFAAWTGVRPGELCALEVTDIDWRALSVRVARNRRNDGTLGPVKGRRRRDIPLCDEAAHAARSLRRSTGPLFRSPTGKALRPNSLRHYWIPVRDAFTAGLPEHHWLVRRLLVDPADQLDPYELRHYLGSTLADRGYNATDIAAMLGNTPRVCEEHYIHAHRDRQMERLREGLNRPVAADPRVADVPMVDERTA